MKSESAIPIPSMRPNHLMRFTQNAKRMKAETKDVTCESHIALHDFSNPRMVASMRLCFSRRASFILSNIRIFASIASPMDRIMPAIDARVRTMPKDFTIAVNMRA